MSCLSDFKVVAILGDKSEDMINENLIDKKTSFIKRISERIKSKFFKIIFGDVF